MSDYEILGNFLTVVCWICYIVIGIMAIKLLLWIW